MIREIWDSVARKKADLILLFTLVWRKFRLKSNSFTHLILISDTFRLPRAIVKSFTI